MTAEEFTRGYIDAHAVNASHIEWGNSYSFGDPLAQFTIDKLEKELALEELSQLTPEQRAEVDLYARQLHYDTYHGSQSRGIYGCCLYPKRPTE